MGNGGGQGRNISDYQVNPLLPQKFSFCGNNFILLGLNVLQLFQGGR